MRIDIVAPVEIGLAFGCVDFIAVPSPLVPEIDPCS